MADDYGTDFHCVDDLDAKLSTVSGPMVVVEATLRRYQTDRGALWYDRDYGTDMRQFVNGNSSPFEVARAAELEALKDERVEEADAEVTFAESKLTIVVRLVLATGTFVLTIDVTALTVQLIDFSQAA